MVILGHLDLIVDCNILLSSLRLGQSSYYPSVEQPITCTLHVITLSLSQLRTVIVWEECRKGTSYAMIAL